MAEGTDLDDPPVSWEIGRSTEVAAEGSWSARFSLANYNDRGKIWIRRSVETRPNTTYAVEIAFRFATRDWGLANLWTLIAGATATPPSTAADLPFQGHTGNGAQEDVGWVWLEKRYHGEVTTGADGRVHVVIGVWGTWETARTYFVDVARVRLTNAERLRR